MSENAIRVSSEDLRRLTIAFFEKAGTSTGDAEFMARLLVQTDLRGVFTHGTWQLPGYVRKMLDGQVNPRPTVRAVNQTRTTQVLDGDGGLGHFPCYQGTHWAVRQAREYGTAAVTTYRQREQDYAREGIPLTVQHKQRLEDLAAELGVETSFAAEV